MWTSTRPTSPTGARSRRLPRLSAPVRRCAAVALFTLLVAFAGRPLLLTIPFRNNERLQQQMFIEPDRGGWFPSYPAFLDELRGVTKPGDTIALVVPPKTWDGGYSYAYYRASYFLAGRQVLPVVDAANHALTRNIAAARYLAVWRTPVPPGWRVAWTAHRGALLVR